MHEHPGTHRGTRHNSIPDFIHNTPADVRRRDDIGVFALVRPRGTPWRFCWGSCCDTFPVVRSEGARCLSVETGISRGGADRDRHAAPGVTPWRELWQVQDDATD